LFFSPLSTLSLRGHRTYDSKQLFSRPTEIHPEICENCRCAFLYTFSSNSPHVLRFSVLWVFPFNFPEKKISPKLTKICTRTWVRGMKFFCKEKYYLLPTPNQPTPCVQPIPPGVTFSNAVSKAQSSKLERFISLKCGKRDVRALSFELSNMSPQVGLAVIIIPSTQSNLFPILICFFYVVTHKVSTSIRGGFPFKVGLGISRTNADSQWNPVYNVFHRNFGCGNETIRR